MSISNNEQSYYYVDVNGMFFWGYAGPIDPTGSTNSVSITTSGFSVGNNSSNVMINGAGLTTGSSVVAASVQGADEVGSI